MTKTESARVPPGEETIPVDLGPVQRTLLIPLLGRARETQRARGLLRDHKAVEIVKRLDYDFSKWEGGPSLAGSCLRTVMFDRFVQDFLARAPRGTVVEIGCGLNTRFDRIDNGQATWFDIDLPDAIALRRRFFEDAPRRTMIAASVLEAGWHSRVAATNGPWMFVAEAVLIYLDAADARLALLSLAERFPGAFIAFDTTSGKMVDAQAKHDAMRHLPRESWYRWRCDDPLKIESWGGGLQIVATKTFFDAEREALARLPFRMSFAIRFLPFLVRSKISGYRVNLAEVGGRRT
jgi:O-methyltransferase involved in polyketide biosynthesis